MKNMILHLDVPLPINQIKKLYLTVSSQSNDITCITEKNKEIGTIKTSSHTEDTLCKFLYNVSFRTDVMDYNVYRIIDSIVINSSSTVDKDKLLHNLSLATITNITLVNNPLALLNYIHYYEYINGNISTINLYSSLNVSRKVEALNAIDVSKNKKSVGLYTNIIYTIYLAMSNSVDNKYTMYDIHHILSSINRHSVNIINTVNIYDENMTYFSNNISSLPELFMYSTIEYLKSESNNIASILEDSTLNHLYLVLNKDIWIKLLDILYIKNNKLYYNILYIIINTLYKKYPNYTEEIILSVLKDKNFKEYIYITNSISNKL